MIWKEFELCTPEMKEILGMNTKEFFLTPTETPSTNEPQSTNLIQWRETSNTYMNHIGIFFWFFVVMMMVRLLRLRSRSCRLLLFFVILIHVSMTCYECLLWELHLSRAAQQNAQKFLLIFFVASQSLALTMVKTEINDGWIFHL